MDIKEDTEVRHAIEGKASGKGKRRRMANLPMATDDSDSDESMLDVPSPRSTKPVPMDDIQVSTKSSLLSSAVSSTNRKTMPPKEFTVGSALKRTEDGALPTPKMVKKKAKKKLVI